jgi:thiamine-phosphate pyrophosphorylase
MPLGDLGSERRARLAAARLYLVCGARVDDGDLPDLLRAAVAGGVEVVQLREKHLGDEELVAVADAARALCERLGALFIVNDRPWAALEAGADGVHVGQDDLPVAEVRELVGPDMLVGLSTHTPGQIDKAVRLGRSGETVLDSPTRSTTHSVAAMNAAGDLPQGPDYIGVGPVHTTPTKPGRAAVGLELVRYAAAHAQIPFFAIGGIEAGNASFAIEAGARRVAVVRAIAEAEAPGRAAHVLRALLDATDETAPQESGAGPLCRS